MTNSQNNNTSLSWFWQDYVSTYRYWGLVLASVLVTLTSMSVFGFVFSFLASHDLPISSLGYISALGSFGRFIGILVVVYFLRRQLKLALIIFALIAGVSALLLLSGNVMEPTGLVLLLACVHIGSMGFMITTIAALVGGRPEIGTFVITYSVILFWGVVAQLLPSTLMGLLLERNLQWLAGVPALLAILVLLPMSGKMFSQKPETMITATPAHKREPVIVFLFSAIIPFYLLFWLYRQPGELMTLTPNTRQPSRAGILCTSFFAPFILPVWFHDTRKELADKLPGRSPKIMGVIAFLFPMIAAAMAQSDNNAVSTTEN